MLLNILSLLNYLTKMQNYQFFFKDAINLHNVLALKKKYNKKPSI